MPEAVAFLPEAFAGAAEFAPEVGLAAADVGAEAAIGAGELAGGAIGGAELAGGLDAGITAADAGTAAATASGIGGELVSPSLSAEFAPSQTLGNFEELGPPTTGEMAASDSMMSLGGPSTSGLEAGVEQGGLAGEFTDAGLPTTPTDLSMSQGTFAGQPQGGWPDYTGDPATFQNDPMGTTVTTTTGPAKAGGLGGLFNNPTQLATMAGLGLASFLGPGNLPQPAGTISREANQLLSVGNEEIARAQANQISDAQRAQLADMRAQLVSQAAQQVARTSPGGQIDPQNDSRFLGMVTAIDNAIAKQYQAFVDAEYAHGIQAIQLADPALFELLRQKMAQDQAFNNALMMAGLASSGVLGGGGGGTTTTTTIGV